MAIVYTRNEERANYWSHAAGVVLGAAMSVWFLHITYTTYDGWACAGIWLYAIGLLFSYVSSTVYHACPADSRWREPLRKADHAAIYWHIAGSYSPLTLVALREGAWGWPIFCFVWGCALAGTFLSFYRLSEHSNRETICFVGIGLVALLALEPLLDNVGWRVVGWILAEGAAYITGAVFYSLHKRCFMHTVFHGFVLLGTACHIIAVWQMLNP